MNQDRCCPPRRRGRARGKKNDKKEKDQVRMRHDSRAKKTNENFEGISFAVIAPAGGEVQVKSRERRGR